ncbi:MAG: energy transducer TonB [Pseudomonadota bacterium]
MRTGLIKWPTALFLSFLVHAGIAGYFKKGPEEILIEGGAPVEMATLGNAFADTIASGDPSETMEPVEPVEEELEPVEELTRENAVEPLETMQPVTPEVTQESNPLQEVTQTPQPVTEPLEPNPQEQLEIAALTPETLEEAQTPDVLAPAVPEIETVPVPQQRQVIEPKPEPKKQAEPKPKKEQVKKPEPKKPVKKKAEQKKKKREVASGDRGKQKSTQKSGAKDGKAEAKSKKTGRKNRLASLAGNAAVSNYPGKIVRKLRRSLRYPSAAKKKKIRGQVMVSFTVSRGGQVSGVRVVKGSGSSILDDAAVKTVLRAAPFPKIPEGAGKSRWAFRVPLAFQ